MAKPNNQIKTLPRVIGVQTQHINHGQLAAIIRRHNSYWPDRTPSSIAHLVEMSVERLGTSKQELAQLMGLSRQTVYNNVNQGGIGKEPLGRLEIMLDRAGWRLMAQYARRMRLGVE
jgi:hypothetical protein